MFYKLIELKSAFRRRLLNINQEIRIARKQGLDLTALKQQRKHTDQMLSLLVLKINIIDSSSEQEIEKLYSQFFTTFKNF